MAGIVGGEVTKSGGQKSCLAAATTTAGDMHSASICGFAPGSVEGIR